MTRDRGKHERCWRKGNDYMKEHLKFSVSMCVYGGDSACDFDVAMWSIINQTLKPNEIILVVDGQIPTRIEDVIKKFKNQLSETDIILKVIYLEKNMGHGEARRIGLNSCSHDLIALMDADDISVPKRFEKQLDFFERHSDVSAVGGNIYEFIGEPQNCVGKRLVPETDFEIKRYMKKRCPMNQVTVMFKKKDISAVGGYIDWYCEEDYYLWIRLALAGMKFGNIQDNLVYVRVGKEMYQRRGGWKYFKSESRLQKFMLTNKMIGIPRYIVNIAQRIILQLILPNRLRGFVFKKFARA